MTTATTLSDLRCTLGEGIVWDDAQRLLWWTDIQESLLWQHDPATGRSANGRCRNAWALSC